MTFWRSSPGKLSISSFGSGRGAAYDLRGGGVHLGPNDFPVLGNSFRVFSPKIPCSIA
jgi:hypothetical protein